MNGFTSPEIEQAFISCLMQWPTPCFRVSEDFSFKSDHFQVPRHRTLFDALFKHWQHGKPMDLVAFTFELDQKHLLAGIGGAVYLAETWTLAQSPDVASYYAEQIMEARAKQQVLISCKEIAKESNGAMVEAQPLIEEAMKRLSEIKTKPKKHRTFMEAIQDKLERMQRGEQPEQLVKTGLGKLDSHSRMCWGDMPIIIGKRKAGKSIMALTIALNVAKRGVPVCIFSLEMPEHEVVDRLFAGFARTGMHEEMDVEQAVQTASGLYELPVHIKDDCRTLASIVATARELKARCGIGLIIVDYAQIVQVTSINKDANREQHVAEVSRTLRNLAMELYVPTIVLSQLNDNDQTRESRSLEQDCTACWWVVEPKKDDEPNTRIIRIPYQRNGESGIAFKVTFLGAMARMENYWKDE